METFISIKAVSSQNCHLLAILMAHFLTSFRSRLRYQFTTKAFSDHHSETAPPSPPLLSLVLCPFVSCVELVTRHTTYSLVCLLFPPLEYKLRKGRTVLLTAVSPVLTLVPGMLWIRRR